MAIEEIGSEIPQQRIDPSPQVERPAEPEPEPEIVPADDGTGTMLDLYA
ncbi:MAG: hypothetical protein KKA67_13125 [Spirochaetes bacterium]|nr:hypothetical protein [Spirochaetota bacterium]MBU1081349.1 hypothetical protein [Spirochaetota bacterium]